MQEDLRWASHWVPTHPQDTGPCVVGPVSAAASQERMSHRTMKRCTHTLLLRFLTQWRSSRPSPPPTCPFREVFIAELRTLFPLHLALHSSWRRNTRNLSLTCPERGLEQRWACRGGRWSATSAPPWAPPTSSSPRAALGRTGWAPRSLGKARGCEHTCPPPQLPDSIKKKKKSKFWKAKKTQITQSAGKINILKMWLIADEEENPEFRVSNSQFLVSNTF